MVLYHCCMSLHHAEEVVQDGFRADEFIAVTLRPPYLTGTSREAHAVVMFGGPATFNLEHCQSRKRLDGEAEYLVHERVLNMFQRAVWPH